MRHTTMLALTAAMAWCLAAAADVWTPALTEDQVDWAASGTVLAGESEAMVPDVGREILGWPREYGPRREWMIRMQRHPAIERDAELHYLIRFKAPVAIGSLGVRGARCQVLKPGGSPDPLDPEQWLTPTVPPGQNVSLIPLPPSTVTQAVLLTVTIRRGAGDLLPTLRTWRERLYNWTPLAIANAESEYTVQPDMGPPFTLSAANLVRGSGRWQNTGPDKRNNDRVPRPPVSDVAPSWLVLSWDEARPLSALQIGGNLNAVKLYTFAGADDVNPAVASDRDWRLVRVDPRVISDDRGNTTVRFAFPAVTTRGLRLWIEGTTGGPIATVNDLQALQQLGDQPVPEPERTSLVIERYPIPYTLPEDGLVTLVVEAPDGRRVRNLIARRERLAGANHEPWDLKDEAGTYVTPGAYRYRAIWHPPLTMRYEMTPYPNIAMHAPGNSPWLTGHSGTGGWLADHTPPLAVCAIGERVFIGSPTAEGGVALIETDRDGRKRWGHHNFMAWTGPQRMAANATDLFVHAWKDNADHIWRISLETKEVKEIFNEPSTTARRRGIRGIAATADTLYFAVRGQDQWLSNAFGAADVDIDACWPKFREKDERDRYAPDLRDDFLRLFRLTGTPAGQRGGLTYLESGRGPERKQHLVLAMRREVPIGSLVLPMPKLDGITVTFSLLKPGAAWPPSPERDADWLPIDTEGRAGWTVLTAPPGATTRALRISFIRGEADAIADLLGDDALPGGNQNAWSGQVEGMKILRRRYVPCPAPEIRVSSGNIGKDGTWDARRDQALSPDDPGIYLMTWAQPQTMRGLAVKEIDGKETRIDVFTGPPGAEIDLAGDAHWEEIAVYHQARRYYYQPDPNRNSDARYLDGYVDFGRDVETRAVRLRVVAQWTERATGRDALYGVREDRGGMELDPARCRVYGVLPLRHVGEEPPVDPLIAERLEAYELASGKTTREVGLAKGGDLAFAPDGQLYALSGNQVVRIAWAGDHQPFITDLIKPTAIGFGPDGSFYAFDAAPERQVVRVYNAAGAYQRDLGTPGGFRVGAWDATRMGNVSDLAVDPSGQLWLTEFQHHPKRVTRWRTDGTFLAEHFDRTIYGGGGVLDPQDKRLLYYGPCEFELNWETGQTRLRNLTSLGGKLAAEQPVYLDGRKYLVSRESFFRQPIGVVYRYDNGVGILAAAIGHADQFPPLKQPEVLATLDGQALATLQFVWCDRNDDGAVQAAEVVFSPRTIRHVTNFDQQLGLSSGNTWWQAASFTPAGAPLYVERQLPLPGNRDYYQLRNGNFFAFGEAAVYTPEGKQLWRYPTEGTGVHAYYSAKPLHPEQVVSEFSIIGHAVAPEGDLGEFLVTSANSGIWHIWTVDGLLAGSIFRDLRDPRARQWAMEEHDRGMLLPTLTAGQEHFWGNVTLAEGGRAYGIWMSTNVFEIAGLNRFKRFAGELTVTDDDLRQAVAAERQQLQQQVYREARVYACRPAPVKLAVDGRTEDWEHVQPMSLLDDSTRFNAALRLTRDKENLYLLYETVGMGPLKNSGEDARGLFKSGACVDLMLGTDPAARPSRQNAVAGDVRLLFSTLRGKPVAVLYEALVPGVPKDDEVVFATMVFRTAFSRVRVLDEARVSIAPAEQGYVLEASVPLKSLGLAPANGTVLKMDWGILRTDESGNGVLGRHYWSNQATSILSDIAAEAELTPTLWGHLRFDDKAGPGARPQLPGLDTGTADPGMDNLLDELDEDLK